MKKLKPADRRVPIITTVPPDLRAQADRLAKQQSRTRSKIMELALQAFVEQQKKGA